MLSKSLKLKAVSYFKDGCFSRQTAENPLPLHRESDRISPSLGRGIKGEGKKGFTLAEVLIALTIIGIIAAITVPAVISSQKDEILTVQFKKSFSTLSQAVSKTVMTDYAGDSGCYYGQDGSAADWKGCYDFYETLARNLNITKFCRGNALNDGCVPVYPSYPAASGSGCGGYSEVNINNRTHVMVLADGQIIIPYYNGDTDRAPLFLTDINGFKGPNKYGYDLFSLQLLRSPDKGIYLAPSTGSGCFGTVSGGGRSASRMMKHAYAGTD